MCRKIYSRLASVRAAESRVESVSAMNIPATRRELIRGDVSTRLAVRLGNAGMTRVTNDGAGTSFLAIRSVRFGISAGECRSALKPITLFQLKRAALVSIRRTAKVLASLVTHGKPQRKILASSRAAVGGNQLLLVGAGQISKSFILRTDAPALHTHPRNEKSTICTNHSRINELHSR